MFGNRDNICKAPVREIIKKLISGVKVVCVGVSGTLLSQHLDKHTL